MSPLICVEIDGTGVHAIFEDRWKKMSIRCPAGFHRDHYKDLVSYLFAKEPGESVAVSMYMDVPTNHKEVESYTPQVEYWKIVFDN